MSALRAECCDVPDEGSGLKGCGDLASEFVIIALSGIVFYYY